MSFRICSCLAVLAFIPVLTPCLLFAQQLPFRDNFNDGDAMDGLPGTWLPAASPGGTRDASSGDLVATIADRDGMSTSVEELTGLRDMSIRVQLRFTEVSGNGDIASLWGRSPSNDDPAAYAGGIGTDGSLFISYFDGQNANVLRSLQTTLNPVSADVLLQFDILGDQLSLTAWTSSSPTYYQGQ